MVSNLKSNDAVKMSAQMLFRAPRKVRALVERGEMSIEVTSNPRASKANVWQPAPAPTSKTRLLHKLSAVRSIRDM